MHSPIKYFGGKTYMVNIIKEQFPDNYNIYIQGFGGGGSLLFSKQIDKIEIYNDLGQNVYSLFKVLSDKTLFAELKEKLDLTYYSNQIRAEFKQKIKQTNLSLVDRAFCFIYINRTSYNGVGGFSSNLLVRRNISKSTSDYLSMIDGLPLIHQRYLVL